MGSPIAKTHLSPPPPFFFTNPTNSIRVKPISKNPPIPKPTSKNPTSSVSEKLQSLRFEFRSLPEPIDRVKRLLHYAAILPPLEDSRKIQENRVVGCATQVWVEAAMDVDGAMRFRVDSDSEITKGFCCCLMWVLDGAAAEEVLSVRSADLAEMNVGLPSRGNSRVNAWSNILIGMQRKTKVLLEEREQDGPTFFFAVDLS